MSGFERPNYHPLQWNIFQVFLFDSVRMHVIGLQSCFQTSNLDAYLKVFDAVILLDATSFGAILFLIQS